MFLNKKKYVRLAHRSQSAIWLLLLAKWCTLILMFIIVLNATSLPIQGLAYFLATVIIISLASKIIPGRLSKKCIIKLVSEGIITDGVITECGYEGFRVMIYVVHYSFRDEHGEEHINQFVIQKHKTAKFGIAEGNKIKVIYKKDNPAINAAISDKIAMMLYNGSA